MPISIKRIILSTEERIVFPSCAREYELAHAISCHTSERYEQAFTDTLARDKKQGHRSYPHWMMRPDAVGRFFT